MVLLTTKMDTRRRRRRRGDGDGRCCCSIRCLNTFGELPLLRTSKAADHRGPWPGAAGPRPPQAWSLVLAGGAGAAPSPRGGAGFAAAGGRLYVYGGAGSPAGAQMGGKEHEGLEGKWGAGGEEGGREAHARVSSILRSPKGVGN